MKKKNKLTYEDGTPVLTHQDRKRAWDFTPAELRADPWKIWKKMNQFDCVAHLDKYCKNPDGPRTGTKSKVEKRLDDIWIAKRYEDLLEERSAEELKRQAKQDDEWQNYVHQIKQIRDTAIEAARILIKNPTAGDGTLRSYKRTIGQIISDLGSVNSGLMSLEAYQILTRKPEKMKELTTADHYHPRSRSSSMDIILHAKSYIEKGEDYTMKDVFPLIVTRCEVAILTKAENLGDLNNKWQTEALWIDAPTSYDRAISAVVRVGEYCVPGKHRHMAEVLGVELPAPTAFPNAITTDQANEMLTQTDF